VTLAGVRFSEESVVVGVTVSTVERSAAPIVTEVEAVTGLVDTVKLANVAPAGTVTLAGTEATPGLLLESRTSAPPGGAAALRITVPIEAVPPRTLVGSRVNDERLAAGVTVNAA
jgi:hypothetical protein